MLNFILLFVVTSLVYYWFNKKPNNFPPGPPTVPILGSLPFIKARNFHLELERLKNKYGPIIGFKFGSIPVIAVCGTDECLEVLKRSEFDGRSNLIIGERKSEGIMFANGNHWKEQRRFTLRHLRDFGFGKTVVADMIQEELNEFCAKHLEGKSTVQISCLFNPCAFNILWAMIGGSRLSYDDPDFHEVVEHLELLFRQGNFTGGVNAIPFLRQFISLFYVLDSDRTDKVLQAFFMRSLNEHRATKTETPRDLLDVYIDELDSSNRKSSFSVDTLFEVLRELFSAGTESSSNTVSFAILYLIHYPQWQDKLIKEIDEVLAGRPPTWEDRLSLPLVEAFLSESQRCNTIAPLTVPHATTKDTQLNGYLLPKGTMIHVNLWSILQDKKLWGDPEVFRPERFLDNEGKHIKDPNMLVFGTGARNCPGETLAKNFVFLFFVSLLQRYRFTLPKGAPLPTTVCQFGFTTAPQAFSVDLNPRA